MSVWTALTAWKTVALVATFVVVSCIFFALTAGEARAKQRDEEPKRSVVSASKGTATATAGAAAEPTDAAKPAVNEAPPNDVTLPEAPLVEVSAVEMPATEAPLEGTMPPAEVPVETAPLVEAPLVQTSPADFGPALVQPEEFGFLPEAELQPVFEPAGLEPWPDPFDEDYPGAKTGLLETMPNPALDPGAVVEPKAPAASLAGPVPHPVMSGESKPKPSSVPSAREAFREALPSQVVPPKKAVPPASTRPTVAPPVSTRPAAAPLVGTRQQQQQVPQRGTVAVRPVVPLLPVIVRGTPAPRMAGGKQALSAPPSVAPRHALSLGRAVNGVVETLQGAASAAAGVLGGTVVDEPPSDNPSAGSGASSGAMPEPSLPPAPLPPLGGSSFSLSGAQAGVGGLLAPVLVGVLAAGLVLLRPDGLLSRVFCALMQPGSAVPVPLERPG